MKIAVIIGGWYFPKHLYKNTIKAAAPEGSALEFFVVTHRDPSEVDISSEMLPRIVNKNKYDLELYTEITTFKELSHLGYQVLQAPNVVGDYFFFNQWAEVYDYSKYDYIVFMHDDNYLLEGFKDIFTDIFRGDLPVYKHDGTRWHPAILDQFDYIANSPVGTRRTARGSFSIWSRNFIDKLGGEFSMNNVNLTRQDRNFTPENHLDLAEWNIIGHNLQRFVEDNNFMDTTFRLSEHYRVSKYMIECERGLVSKEHILKQSIQAGYERYIK